MTLQADLRATAGTFTLAVAGEWNNGDVVAVVGPNGAGKSTLLRAIAGLAPATGELRIGGVDVLDKTPARRGVGWVPQDGALFPHLSAADNVAFGLSGRRGRNQATQWLERFGIGVLADRRPGQLSGGQAQKVALARALAREPHVLLLDEPLAALDVEARTDVRRSLRMHLADFDGVTMLVTHDAVDVMTLANRVLALDHGATVQDDTVVSVTTAPRTPWLAALMGGNGFYGRTSRSVVALHDGGQLVAAELPGEDGVEVLAVVPAHAVTLHRSRPEGSARNVWPAAVRDLAVVGGRVRVTLDGTPAVLADVTTAAAADLSLREGVDVWASVKATEVTVVVL
ncbi:MAG: molybdate transport system ATP-binding protein [Frankiaceae bacterium]|nr:molybdate transport system ATP-binding protein [Frankiaceae bacterium]